MVVSTKNVAFIVEFKEFCLSKGEVLAMFAWAAYVKNEEVIGIM